MARGNARRTRSNNGEKEKRSKPDSAQGLFEEIDSHWASMPPQLKPFLLKNSNQLLNLRKLVTFWSNPMMNGYTRGDASITMCGVSWFIATRYLKMGMIWEAKALTLNGCFLQQSHHTPIESIVQMCGERFDKVVNCNDLPLFNRGFHATRTPETMAAFLDEGLPDEYQNIMSSYAKTSTPVNMAYTIGQISDDWKSSYSLNRRKQSSETNNGTEIQLILVDNTNRDQCYTCTIGSSSTLKTLFKSHAEQRGVSLRSLRFSYKGNTLFLSSVGNKTPDELNMHTQDRILVHDANALKETNNSSSNQVDARSTQKKCKSNNCPRKVKSRRNNAPVKSRQSMKTLEECRSHHSNMLTKLHDEVQHRLKEIRNRLNSLDLERQPPKPRKRGGRKKMKSKAVIANDILPNLGTGGKAGKPYFLIQVGEVENLYKTSKPCHLHHPGADTMIDLHGCTKNEALNILNEKLPGWVESAMEGHYPWVIPVKIVCGCGHQILSDAVHDWIKSKRQVSNAPKNSIH